jgi:diguanylate cyclase (GGDEF)-like protein
VNASEGAPDLDAAITFGDLEEVLGARGVNILAQPTWFSRVPEERRRHQSAAGGMPLELLEEFKQASARFRLVRGLDQLPAIARAVSVDRMDLGFVDILSYEGLLDHPLAGPKDQLFWRRALIASTEPPRAPSPVFDRTVVASIGAIFEIQPQRMEPDTETVSAILKAIGLGPNGRPWDCGACGFDTCQKFAEVAAAGRASLRQCLPYQERRAEDAQKAAAVDLLTGLSTYRVLRDRLSFEIERSRRNGETFAVLFLDLDRFKQVNDTYGHEAGNEILRAASAEIRNAVRASDVAARYGGDEFVVILTRTDLAGATRVAEALRAGIEGVGRRLGYESGLITVSCGIAEFDPKQPGEGDLLVTADRALYRAKAAGRNVVA